MTSQVFALCHFIAGRKGVRFPMQDSNFPVYITYINHVTNKAAAPRNATLIFSVIYNILGPPVFLKVFTLSITKVN